MRPYLVLLAASLSCFSLLVTAAPAAACSCARAADAATAMAAAHTVFEGRVVQINPENAQAAQPAPALLESEPAELHSGLELTAPKMLYRFEVLRSWKGDPATLVTIETPSQSATCGRSYVKDQSYLIYAFQGSEGRLADNSCTRSAPSGQATEDIDALAVLSTSSSQPPEATEEQPTKTRAQSSTTSVKTAERDTGSGRSGPGCTMSAAKRSSDSTSWALMLLIFGGILNRRQRP
jgi:hypothetical protein